MRFISHYPLVVIDSLAVVLVHHMYNELKILVLLKLTINFGEYFCLTPRKDGPD